MRKLITTQGMTPHVQGILSGDYDIIQANVTKPTILDIGANVGAFTAWASERWPDYEKIHLYEPHPKTFVLLKKNMVSMMVRDYELHNVAVMKEPGEVKLYHGQYNCGEVTATPEVAWGRVPDEHNCTATAIAIRDLPKASIVKCDAEGMEGDLMSEYKHWETVDLFLVEYHSPQLCYDIFNKSYALGFILCGGRAITPLRGEYLFARHTVLDQSKMLCEKTYVRC